jgi:hypothetical protein
MDRRLVFRPRPTCVEAMGDPGRYPPRAEWTWCVADLSKGLARAATSVKARGAGLDWQEKPMGEHDGRPYRKPTLVGGCECTKVGERTFVKELGNLTP